MIFHLHRKLLLWASVGRARGGKQDARALSMQIVPGMDQTKHTL